MSENTTSEIVINLFKMLATGLSLAIALPAAFSDNYNVFILTVFVYIFGKLIDSVSLFFHDIVPHLRIIHGLGCFIGVISLVYCLYFMSAVSELFGMGGSVDNIQTVLLHYPLLNNEILITAPILIMVLYFLADFWCMIYSFCKVQHTKNLIRIIKKK